MHNGSIFYIFYHAFWIYWEVWLSKTEFIKVQHDNITQFRLALAFTAWVGGRKYKIYNMTLG